MGLVERLSGGSARSLGDTEAVVAEVLADPGLVSELLGCVLDADEIVRMRASDALEKVARVRSDPLAPYAERLLTQVAEIDQPSVRWHLAQLLAEVPLDAGQRSRALRLLRWMLAEESDWIVLTCAMSAATDLALASGDVPDWLVPGLDRHRGDPRKAVAKRAARQLARLGVTPAGG